MPSYHVVDTELAKETRDGTILQLSLYTGSMDIEQLFKELMRFFRDLDEEERRHVRENELTIFDILTKPEPKLTKTQEIDVKKIARELLAKLKARKTDP
jgi:type I restriction enzyme R subunit